MDRLDCDAALLPACEGWEILCYPSLDSTNVEATRRVAKGFTHPQALWAETQTAGQGRLGRSWESATGKGLWVSMILPVTVPLEELARSTLVLGVAVREAVLQATGIKLACKWPNDLLHDGAKCCGMLVEAAISAAQDMDASSPHSAEGEDAVSVPLIMGVGLNVNHEQGDFDPARLRAPATSLRLIGKETYSRSLVLKAVLQQISYWFGLWQREGFMPVRDAWLAGNCTLEKNVLLPEGYAYTHGKALDLAPDGTLVVCTRDGTALHIDSGEIRLIEA